MRNVEMIHNFNLRNIQLIERIIIAENKFVFK